MDSSSVKNDLTCVKQQSIYVSCRVRPLSPQEALNPRAHVGVQCLNDTIVVEPPNLHHNKSYAGTKMVQSARQFRLNDVFHAHTSQDEVYRTTCRHVVRGLFDGVNGSILAYGATGSGKTHTMFGMGLSAGGVIYQCVQDIFDEKDVLEAAGRYVAISCTFLEVYNEEVFDLLCTKRVPLTIREEDQLATRAATNPEGIAIKGLTRAAPRDLGEFDRIIEKGRKNRFVAATNANEQSSRSHAIISVEVEVRERESSPTGTVARIRLCDLAGSERAAASSNTGIRIREGGNINRSLLALGAVVQALAKRSRLSPAKAAEVFVPYRGSKLTRLLRDCLGGNCRTSMIFCVSPSCLSFEESVNTLLFAMQAKLVQIAARRNEFKVNAVEVAKNQEQIIERLRLELAVMKDELLKLSNASGIAVDIAAITESIDPSVALRVSDNSAAASVSSPAKSPSHSGASGGSAAVGDLGGWQELQARLKAATDTKMDLHRRLQDNGDKQEALEQQVRRERTALCELLASMPRGELPSPPPVRVVGQLQSISDARIRLEELRLESTSLSHQVDTITAKRDAFQLEQCVQSQKRLYTNSNLYICSLYNPSFHL